MVNEGDRYVLNKVYVGRAMLFGLVYGLIIGLVVGILIAVLGLVGVDTSSLEMVGIGGGAFMMFVMPIVFCTAGGVIIGLIGSLLYNLVALVGIKLHINLGKYMIAAKPIVKPAVVKPVTASSGVGVQVK